MLKSSTLFWVTHQNAFTPRSSGRSAQSRLSWKLGMPFSMSRSQGLLISRWMYSQCRLGPKVYSKFSFWINHPILSAKATSMATLVVLSRPACPMSLLLIFRSTSEPCRTQSHFTYQCEAWLLTNKSPCRPQRRWLSRCWMMAHMKCSPSTTQSK